MPSPASIRPTGSTTGPIAVCSIAPPFLLARIAAQGTPEQRAAAVRTLVQSAAIRARRSTLTYLLQQGIALPTSPALTAGETISVYDVAHGGDADLPGTRMRGNDDPPSDDDAVNEAFEGADVTYTFYRDVLGRDSVDGNGLELVSSVHYGTDFDNAFWNGQQMVYGDGSGELFVVGGLTKDIDVIAHELTHGVTQYTAGLVYHTQSGALNESFSDVFGILTKQYAQKVAANDSDWLIGEGILGTALHGKALRSMSDPGSAYDGDPQPKDMDGYVDLPDDNDPHHDHGGVHINSGIPNRAFHLTAVTIGGNAWESAGHIWYDTLTGGALAPTAQFVDAANATIAAAGSRFGDGSSEQQAVRDAWTTVKVL